MTEKDRIDGRNGKLKMQNAKCKIANYNGFLSCGFEFLVLSFKFREG